jgi:hypothetical protein
LNLRPLRPERPLCLPEHGSLIAQIRLKSLWHNRFQSIVVRRRSG